MAEQFNRKKFLLKCGILGGGGLLLLAGCSDGSEPGSKNPEGEAGTKPTDTVGNNPADCNDLRGVSQAEIDKRQKLGYVKEAPSPDVRCEICKLYLPADAGKKCGSCSLFKGPVATGASCTYFAPLSEEEG